MSNQMDDIERLFNKVPFLRCPKCGCMDPSRLSLVYDCTVTMGIKEIDQPTRRVVADSFGDSESFDIRNSRLHCAECCKNSTDTFPLPDNWSWE